MAVNDLMMKIQVLVEGGKSSAELNRLQKELRQLQTKLTDLEQVELKPLASNLEKIRQAASTLRQVNLKNFASTLDDVKASFAGLGIGTQNLDDLRTAYQRLNTQLSSGVLKQHRIDLANVNKELVQAKRLMLTAAGTQTNVDYTKALSDLKFYNNLINDSTRSILNQKSVVQDLKQQLSALQKYDFAKGSADSFIVKLKEINQLASSTTRGANSNQSLVSNIDYSIKSLSRFNALLKQNQSELSVSQNRINMFAERLSKLRVEAQRVAIPDLSRLFNGESLVNALNTVQSKIQELRTKSLVPFANDLRKLQSHQSQSKAYLIDPLKSAVTLSKALNEQDKRAIEIAKSKIGTELTEADANKVIAKLKEDIFNREGDIVRNNLKAAQLNDKLTNGVGKLIASTKALLDIEKNKLDVMANEEKVIKSLIKSQKDSAKIAADSVKTRIGGINDIKTLKANAEIEAKAYRQNIATLKEYLRGRQAIATADADSIKQRIQSAQQGLAQAQLTKAEYARERASIKESIAAEKEKSRVYQQGLSDNAKGLKASIAAELENEKSIKRQIADLRTQTTAQAALRKLQLEQQLSSATGRKTGIQQQLQETEQATKAELARIRALNASEQAMARQRTGIGLLGNIAGGAAGPLRQFGAALGFMLGPQMAGFAAGAAVLKFTQQFVEANKTLESFIRTFNSLKGIGQGQIEFNTLYGVAQQFGLSVQSITQSYQQLQAASQGTSLEGEKSEKLFAAVARAMSVLGADTVRTHRAFLALNQMISKGQIYAEELRQQLGEAMPDAIQLFAKAANLSIKDYLKNVRDGVYQGEVMADNIVKWTGEVEKRYGGASVAITTMEMAQNRLSNAMFAFNTELGKTGLWNTLISSVSATGNLFLSLSEQVRGFGIEMEALAATVWQQWELAFGGADSASQQFFQDLKNNTNQVELSPTGLIRNFKSVFALLPDEARNALQPIEDAISEIDFKKIITGINSVVVGLSEFVGTNIAGLARMVVSFFDVTAQGYTTFIAKAKIAYDDLSNYIADKQADFKENKLLIEISVADAIGDTDASKLLNAELKALAESERKRKAENILASSTIQSNYDKEKVKLDELLASQNGLIDTNKEQLNEIGRKLLLGDQLLDQNQQDIADTHERLGLYDELAVELGRIDKLFERIRDPKKVDTEATKKQIAGLKEINKYTLQLADSIRQINLTKIRSRPEEYAGQHEFLVQIEKDTQKYVLMKEAQAVADARATTTGNEEKALLIEQEQAILEKAKAIAIEKGNAYEATKITERQIALAKEAAGIKTSEVDVDKGKKAIDNVVEYGNTAFSIMRFFPQSVIDRAIRDGEDLVNKTRDLFDKGDIPLFSETEFMGSVSKVLAGTKKAFAPGVDVPVNWLNFEDPLKEIRKDEKKKVYVEYINTNEPPSSKSASIASANPVSTWSTGGFISGYGGGDRIRALLEPGEFVLNKEAVRSAGLAQVMAWNRGAGRRSSIDQLSIPRFGDGGLVESQPIVINVGSGKSIRLQGSRESARQLADLLSQTGRAL